MISPWNWWGIWHFGTFASCILFQPCLCWSFPLVSSWSSSFAGSKGRSINVDNVPLVFYPLCHLVLLSAAGVARGVTKAWHFKEESPEWTQTSPSVLCTDLLWARSPLFFLEVGEYLLVWFFLVRWQFWKMRIDFSQTESETFQCLQTGCFRSVPGQGFSSLLPTSHVSALPLALMGAMTTPPSPPLAMMSGWKYLSHIC